DSILAGRGSCDATSNQPAQQPDLCPGRGSGSQRSGPGAGRRCSTETERRAVGAGPDTKSPGNVAAPGPSEEVIVNISHRILSGVSDGDRTHEHWSHNPALYQLSYAHQEINSGTDV